MTIEAKVFAKLFTQLCKRLNQAVDVDTIDNYFDILGKRLTTAQFEAGWRKIYEVYEGYNLPTPRAFIDAALGTTEQRADAEWANLITASEDQMRFQVTDSAKAALDQIGGLSSIRAVDGKELSFLHRDYLSFYATHERSLLEKKPEHFGVAEHWVGEDRKAWMRRAMAGEETMEQAFWRLHNGNNPMPEQLEPKQQEGTQDGQ